MDRITTYQAKYLANYLTRRLPANDINKLTASLQDAQVDLTPHQVEAALFAFKSPLSKGAILADEVGLGKTIEAGIILSQHWAKHKRKLLIICPANLRKQWSSELQEMDKLDTWAGDMKVALEREIKDLDAEIKLRKSNAKKLSQLAEKVAEHRIIKELENKRAEKRQNLYETQDEVDARKETLLTKVERMLEQKIEQTELFTIKWRVV